MDTRKAKHASHARRDVAGPRRSRALRPSLPALALAACAALFSPALAQDRGSTAQYGVANGLDPAQLIASQIKGDKAGDNTGNLSTAFKDAYEAVPKDGDNLPSSVFSVDYDVPVKVQAISGLRFTGTDQRRATAVATILFDNREAPIPSATRDAEVVFVKESGRWRIDDVRLLSLEKRPGWKVGREAWVKSSFEGITPGKGAPDPACTFPAPVPMPGDSQSTPTGFRKLAGIGPHEGEPSRQIVADRFVKAIGSSCPFSYQLVDLTGDGLADLVLQLSDRRLGATDNGLRRTVVYSLDRQGRWQPLLEGIAKGVATRTNKSGQVEIELSDDKGAKSWRLENERFVPVN